MSGLLKRVVRQVNSLDADVVVITGDLIDFGNVSRAELAPLATLSAPTYFIIGNHERYVDCDEICERLRGHGLIVLRNETATLNTSGGSFHFLGIDDAEDRQQVDRLLPTLARRPDCYEVLLYHRPDGFHCAADAGIDLMLSGHTHAGQIFPFNFAVKRVFPYTAGLFERAGGKLYVSTGTGTWGPVLRIGSRSEITAFEIS